MNSKKLFLINKLKALKSKREEFISCFLDECTDIYEPIWRFSRQPQIMELAIYKFVVSWLNSHWDTFEVIIGEHEYSDKSEKFIFENELLKLHYDLFFNICKNKSHNKTTDQAATALLMINCADENISCIQDIVNIHENSEKRRNKLRTALYRHKELFQKKIDLLKYKKSE